MNTINKAVRSLTLAGASALLVASVATTISAQTNKGTIKGTVTDQNRAVVQDATVTATNVATNDERTVKTGDDGTYEILALEPGAYKVTVKAATFSDTVQENIVVQTSSTAVVDIMLTAGAGTNVVTVTAAPSLVQSETSDVGSVISSEKVTDLPIPQRNFTLLATLSPGVTRPVVGVLGGSGSFESGSPVGNSTEGTRFRESGGSVLVVNGARPTSNNFNFDRVDNNEGQFAQIGIYPPPDAIAEFKITTSVAPAEAGRAGGGIVNSTTRSGSNEVHGTAYEFYQGRFASALGRNERGQAFIPNRNTHNYGATVGGPTFLPRFGEGGSSIWDGRDRSFWFFYFEGQRNATPAFGGGEFPFVTVPTARMRVGDFGELLQPGTSRTYRRANGTMIVAPNGTVFCATGNPAPANDIRNCGQPLSPAGLATLQAYPLPTEPGLENNYRRNRKEKYNRDGWGLRFDHKITDSNSFFGAYSKDESVRIRDNNFPLGTSPNGNDLPSGFGAGEEFGNSRGIRLGDTHVFSPSVINEMRFGATRVEIGINNPGINGALGFNPNISAALGHRNINICGQCEGVVLLGIEELLNGGRNGGQLEFIGDGGKNDAGDDRHVQIGVGEPRQPAGFGGLRDLLGARLHALVEVDPPDRNAARQRREKGRDVLDRPRQFGEGRALDHEGLAECDDDEQRAALGHVAALDGPGFDGGEAEARRPEAHRCGDVFDGERGDPEIEPVLALGEAAENLQHRGQAEPGQDADGVVADRRAMRGRCQQPERGAADLHRRIGDRKPEPALLECLGNGGGQHEAAEHQEEEQDADRRPVGVEPVGHPGGVNPHPPYREKQQRDLQGAKRREVMQQRVRQLRDGKDEDEVEEQLGIGDAGVPVRHQHAEQRAAWIVRRHGPALASAAR